MNDATGKHVIVGDRVVFSDSKSESSTLKIGVVTGFTPKKIKIGTPNAAWRIEQLSENLDREILKFPDQIAVIDRF